MLAAVSRLIGGGRAGKRTTGEAYAGTDCGTLTTANRSAGRRPDDRADGCAFNAAVLGRPLGRGAADLDVRKITAIHVVGAKLVEGFTGARQHHDAGAGG